MTVHVARRRFTVDDYRRMAASGILGEDDRVELLEGEVVEMSPIGRPHAACVARLIRLFTQLPHADAQVEAQNPIRLDRFSEPEPDLVLLRPRPDFYAQETPGPADVLLACEVADSSLEVDRLKKLPLYAAAGLAEVWIVDLTGEAVEVYREPDGARYRVALRRGRGERVTPSAFPQLELEVDAILGA